MRRFHNLFFALRPPASVAVKVDQLRKEHCLAGPLVPRERLSVAVLSLGQHQVMPLRLIDQISERLADETLPACRVAFDQLVTGRRNVSLSASKSLQDIERLQGQLSGCLENEGIMFERRWSGKQMTLSYNASAASRRTIDPVAWTAGELLLIDSIYGEGKHLTMARWRLDNGVADKAPGYPATPLRQAQQEQLSLFA